MGGGGFAFDLAHLQLPEHVRHGPVPAHRAKVVPTEPAVFAVHQHLILRLYSNRHITRPGINFGTDDTPPVRQQTHLEPGINIGVVDIPLQQKGNAGDPGVNISTADAPPSEQKRPSQATQATTLVLNYINKIPKHQY